MKQVSYLLQARRQQAICSLIKHLLARTLPQRKSEVQEEVEEEAAVEAVEEAALAEAGEEIITIMAGLHLRLPCYHTTSKRRAI